MKLLRIIMLLLAGAFAVSLATAQSNASLNILTLNSGQVPIGSVVDVQVTIGSTGPTVAIAANKVRAQISVPVAIATILQNSDQTGLPTGWSITVNTGGSITICNGSDVIPVGAQRQIFIKVRGTAVGGPSTINGSLLFSSGTICTAPGTLPGDNTADNTATTSIQVNAVAPCNLGVTASAGTITCNGGTTTITATPSNANGSVEYNLNGGSFQSSNTFTVTAGTYTIAARETSNNSCIATATAVTVTDPAILPAPAINTIQPTCSVPTGNVTVTSSTAGLTFSLDGAAYAAYPSGGYTLAPGSHTLRSQNASNCISAVANIDIDAQSAAPVAPVVSIVQPTCTSATGTITVTSSTTGLTFSLDGAPYTAYPAGGYTAAAGSHTLTSQNASSCVSAVTNITVNAQPPLPVAPVAGTVTQPSCTISTGSIELTGLPSGNWTINPGAITGNTATFTINNLNPGTYNYTVTNSVGCTSPASVDIVINNVPGAPSAPAINVVQPNCTVATGSITITSATAGLTFSIDGTTYAAYPTGGYNVAAGSYNITSQNTAGCTSAVTHVTIDAQPPSPLMPTVDIVQPTCALPGGKITVTSSTSGLIFSLDGGAYGTYPAGGYNVGPGAHTITAKNGNACSSPVVNVTINPLPASPAATISAGTIKCFNGLTTLTVNATGGVAPLEYSIDGVNFQPGNTYQVTAGTYIIVIKDINECAVTTAPLIINQPASIQASASSEVPLPCSTTTSFTVTATGGVSPLQYSLDGGTYQSSNVFTVGSGTHTVTVKDANNCTVTTTPLSVSIPNSLVVSANAGYVSRCGGTTTVTVTATGGTTPYASGTGSFIREPGKWQFTVTDAVGCTSTKEIEVVAPGCSNLLVRPNPGRGNTITVNHSAAAPGSKIQLFEINGALLMTKAVPRDAFMTTLDISRLAAGSYMIVYINGDERKATLFVKTN